MGNDFTDQELEDELRWEQLLHDLIKLDMDYDEQWRLLNV